MQELSHYPVLANVDETLRVAKERNVQEIFSTITPEQNKYIYDLMYQSEKECIRFRIVPNLSVFVTREVHIEYYGELPILSLRKEPLDDVGNRIKKRALDLGVSLFVTVFVLSWLIPLIGILILLESGRPIFFKQLRTGKDKKPFYCWKFRSMRKNKDADLFRIRDFATITIYLGPARNARLNKLADHIIIYHFGIIGSMFQHMWPRPYQAHFTSKHINKLREFIKAAFS